MNLFLDDVIGVQSCIVNRLHVLTRKSRLFLSFPPLTGPAVVFSGSVSYRERSALLQTVQWKSSTGNTETIAAPHPCHSQTTARLLLENAHHCFSGHVSHFTRASLCSQCRRVLRAAGLLASACFMFISDRFYTLPMIKRPKWMFNRCCRETRPESADAVRVSLLRYLNTTSAFPMTCCFKGLVSLKAHLLC